MRALRLVQILSLVCVAFSARAAELAQGHHLWATTAPNGTRSFIATYLPDHPSTLPILLRQLSAASSAKRVALSSEVRGGKVAPTGPWAASVEAGLPPELAGQVIAVARSVLWPNYPIQTISTAPLGWARIFLYGSSASIRSEELGPDDGQKALADFVRGATGIRSSVPASGASSAFRRKREHDFLPGCSLGSGAESSDPSPSCGQGSERPSRGSGRQRVLERRVVSRPSL